MTTYIRRDATDLVKEIKASGSFSKGDKKWAENQLKRVDLLQLDYDQQLLQKELERPEKSSQQRLNKIAAQVESIKNNPAAGPKTIKRAEQNLRSAQSDLDRHGDHKKFSMALEKKRFDDGEQILRKMEDRNIYTEKSLSLYRAELSYFRGLNHLLQSRLNEGLKDIRAWRSNTISTKKKTKRESKIFGLVLDAALDQDPNRDDVIPEEVARIFKVVPEAVKPKLRQLGEWLARAGQGAPLLKRIASLPNFQMATHALEAAVDSFPEAGSALGYLSFTIGDPKTDLFRAKQAYGKETGVNRYKAFTEFVGLSRLSSLIPMVKIVDKLKIARKLKAEDCVELVSEVLNMPTHVDLKKTVKVSLSKPPKSMNAKFIKMVRDEGKRIFITKGAKKRTGGLVTVYSCYLSDPSGQFLRLDISGDPYSEQQVNFKRMAASEENKKAHLRAFAFTDYQLSLGATLSLITKAYGQSEDRDSIKQYVSDLTKAYPAVIFSYALILEKENGDYKQIYSLKENIPKGVLDNAKLNGALSDFVLGLDKKDGETLIEMGSPYFNTVIKNNNKALQKVGVIRLGLIK